MKLNITPTHWGYIFNFKCFYENHFTQIRALMSFLASCSHYGHLWLLLWVMINVLVWTVLINQVATLLTVIGCVATAIYGISLSYRLHAWYTLYWEMSSGTACVTGSVWSPPQHGSLIPLKSTSQTLFWSVQPFWHSSWLCPTDRYADHRTLITIGHILMFLHVIWPNAGGSVAEWLACWRGRVEIAVTTLSGNSLWQTVHTRHASVHQAAKLVAALLRVAGVTAGLAESNGSLPPGVWLTSPAGWLPRTRISEKTARYINVLNIYWQNYQAI